MDDKMINGIERYYTDLKNAIAIPTSDIEFLSRLNSSIKESNSSCMEDLLRPVSSWTTFFKYAYCPVINYLYVALRYGLFDEDSLSLLDRFFPRRIKYRAAEIFDIISKVSKENAMLIIDWMSESSDIYESLCEAYENDDETAFVEVITNNKLDTSKIKNICYLFSGFDHSSQKGTGIDLKKIIYTGIPLLTLSEHRTLEYQLAQIQESTVGTNKLYSISLDIQNSLKKIDALFRRIPDVVKFDGDGNIGNISCYNEFVANWSDEWSRYENGFVAIAKKMFYILLKEDPQFSYQEQEVFDEMVTRPEVAEYFCQWREEYLTLSSEELKGEAECTKARSSGRNQGCWLIVDTFAELNRWNTIIQIKVWPKVFKVVSAFKYTKTTSKKLEKAINNMGASLIYKAAENIGIAKEYSKNDVASSYARTMSFIGCERRDIKPYMEMLDVYMQCVEQDKQNKFESRHRLSGDESGTYSRRNSSYNEKMDSVDVRDILADYCNKNEEMAQFLADNKPKIKEALIMIRQLLSSHK